MSASHITEQYGDQAAKAKERYNPTNIVLVSTLVVGLITIAFAVIQAYWRQESFLAVVTRTAGLLAPFYLVGVILKYVDEAYDEGRFPKSIAVLATAIGLAIMVWLSLASYVSATIFLALIVSVAIAGKTAGTPFMVAAGGYIILLFLLDIYLSIDPILFTTIMVVLTADEVGAEVAKKALKRLDFNGATPGWRRSAILFLRDRNLGMLSLLGLALIGQIPFVFWLAWVLLDFGYVTVEGISRRESLRHIFLREVFTESGQSSAL